MRVNGLRFVFSGILGGLIAWLLATLAKSEALKADTIFYMGSSELNESARNAISFSITAAILAGIGILAGIMNLFRVPSLFKSDKKAGVTALVMTALSIFLGIVALIAAYEGYNTLPETIKPFII